MIRGMQIDRPALRFIYVQSVALQKLFCLKLYWSFYKNKELKTLRFICVYKKEG